MNSSGVWKLLHLFFAFSFVGSLVVAEWNGRAARATQNWGERALLFNIIHLATRIAGAGSLLVLGIVGNILATRMGYSMVAGSWLHWVNGLWLAAVLTMLILVMPNAAKLSAATRSVARGESAPGYARYLVRWRIGGVILSLIYLALLFLMVFHWRS
jgi:hypothetical protein